MPVIFSNASTLLLHRYAGAPEPALQVLLVTSMKQEAAAVSRFILVSRLVKVCSLHLLASTFGQGHP